MNPIAIATILPWWLNLAIAAIIYYGAGALDLSNLALHDRASVLGLIEQIVWYGLLIAARAFPALFLLCATVGLIEALFRPRSNGRSIYQNHFSDRVKAKQYLRLTKHEDLRSAIGALSWLEFEQMVGEHFKKMGFSVSETSAGADGGIDLILYRHNKRYLVQCKQWKANKVGVQVVREVYGIISAHAAEGGFVITSGEFTKSAKAFVEGTNLMLVDGKQLHAWFGMGQ